MNDLEESVENLDWKRQRVLDSYKGKFKDPTDLDLLASLPEAFEGTTCGEVEDRYLNLLNYSHGAIPENSKEVLQKPIIHKNEIYDLSDEELREATISENNGERVVAQPILKLELDQPVIDLLNNRIESTVLVKNPFNAIKGETFQWVRTETGSWTSPLVIGVQNGLILKNGKLLVVEGKKNRETNVYEWKVKRPVFDNGKYDELSTFEKILKEKDFTSLKREP